MIRRTILAAGAAAMLIVGSSEAATKRISDPADPCVSVRAPLVDAEAAVSRNVLGGAMAGAGAGFLASVLAQGGRVNIGKVLLGTAAGAAAGAAVGYVRGKQQQGLAGAALTEAIDHDFQTSSHAYSPMANALDGLMRCRREEMVSLLQTVRSNGLSQPQAQAETALLERRIADDDRIMASITKRAGERMHDYIQAQAQAQGVSDAQVLGEVATYTPRVLAVGADPFATPDPPPNPAASEAGAPAMEAAAVQRLVLFAQEAVPIHVSQSAESSTLATLARGDSVETTGASPAGAAWVEVVHNETVGYVAGQQLGPTAPKVITAAKAKRKTPPKRSSETAQAAPGPASQTIHLPPRRLVATAPPVRLVSPVQQAAKDQRDFEARQQAAHAAQMQDLAELKRLTTTGAGV